LVEPNLFQYLCFSCLLYPLSKAGIAFRDSFYSPPPLTTSHGIIVILGKGIELTYFFSLSDACQKANPKRATFQTHFRGLHCISRGKCKREIRRRLNNNKNLGGLHVFLYLFLGETIKHSCRAFSLYSLASIPPSLDLSLSLSPSRLCSFVFSYRKRLPSFFLSILQCGGIIQPDIMCAPRRRPWQSWIPEERGMRCR
jgi:hypothetical protein